MAAFSGLIRRLRHLLTIEIWKPDHLKDRSLRGWLYAMLRVVSITWTVFNETKAASRAAALSYSSMLSLGPLIAITMLVAGLVLDQKDPDLLVNSIQNILHLVAPQVSISDGSAAAQHGQADLANLISGFITRSKSGTAGALGVFSLVFIVLMLFTSIENAFNEIWGVRRGRSWLIRVVFYWAIVTLGALLFFASLTALGAGMLIAKMDLFPGMVTMMKWALPLASVTAVAVVLTLFYRFVPNTHVFWRAALVGAVVVTALIYLNNVLAFTYLRRVLSTRSLYGSVSIIPILMMGLFVFWLFVLVGGQVSYAVQNVHFRNSQAAWSQLAENMRERLTLAVLLTLARRFQDCMPACSAAELGDLLRVPTQIVNECLNRLVDMKLIVATPPEKGSASNDYHYQPSRPLSKICLRDFKRMEEDYGSHPAGPHISTLDPILARYDQELEKATRGAFFESSLEELIIGCPKGRHE